MSIEDWNVHDHYRVGNKYYHRVTCKHCGTYFDKVRQDSLNKKRCCNKKDKAQLLEVGVKFNMLTNIGESHRDNGVVYNWLCDCGNTVKHHGIHVKNGNIKSCGCFIRSKIGRNPEKHGLTDTKEYSVWASIISRTEHPSQSTREWYFDKNIRMSSHWRNSFLNFLSDMGECPEGFTLDRIDPSGDYCRDNCRWASVELQSINKGLFKSNTSGHKGVCFDKASGKWCAYIYYKYVKYNLGFFSNIDDAIEARKKGEDTYWKHIVE